MPLATPQIDRGWIESPIGVWAVLIELASRVIAAGSIRCRVIGPIFDFIEAIVMALEQ